MYKGVDWRHWWRPVTSSGEDFYCLDIQIRHSDLRPSRDSSDNSCSKWLLGWPLDSATRIWYDDVTNDVTMRSWNLHCGLWRNGNFGKSCKCWCNWVSKHPLWDGKVRMCTKELIGAIGGALWRHQCNIFTVWTFKLDIQICVPLGIQVTIPVPNDSLGDH